MSQISAENKSLQEELEALRRRVSELTQTEAALRDEVDLYARILDAMTEMVVVKRPDLSVAYANRAYCEFYGMSRGAILGAQEASYVGADIAAQHGMEDRYIFATGNLARSPVEPLTRSDGRSLPYTSIRTPLRDASGKIAMLVCVLRSAEDEVAHIELALKRSEEHSRALIHAIPDMVFRLSRDGVWLDFSSAKDDTTAVPASVFLGKRVHDILPDMAPEVMRCVEEACRTGKLQTMEYSLLQSGRIGYFEARIAMSGPDEVVSIVRDITEEKRMEETLRESESRFRMLVEQSLVGICVLQDERLVYASPKLAAMHGYTVEEMLALERPFDLITEDRHVVEDLLRKLVESTDSAKGEGPPQVVGVSYRAVRKDGSSFDVEAYAGWTQWGGRPAVIGTLLDVTERKAAEAERARMAEEVMRAQAAVLAELSTPLIPINEGVMVMPLIGEMDATRASRVMERLLDGIAKSRAKAAILDITGMSSVNTHAAGALVRCAQAVRLLGAEVVLTGIRPEVAQTLTTLAVDLHGIVTLGTLQAGIAYAVGRCARQLRS